MCVSVLDGNWGQDVDLEPLTGIALFLHCCWDCCIDGK